MTKILIPQEQLVEVFALAGTFDTHFPESFGDPEVVVRVSAVEGPLE